MVVDLLQTILNEAMHSNIIQAHLPTISRNNFPIIQYADDTILVMPAVESQNFQVNNLLAHYMQIKLDLRSTTTNQFWFP